MERTHLASSSKPIILHGEPFAPGGFYKPPGFWYDCNGSWRRFCAANEVPFAGRFLHRVELRDCSVLRLDTPKKFDAFHKEYISRGSNLFPRCIDWGKVCLRFDGLEISPYQYCRRLDVEYFWYYGWDCASGVIWRPKGATVTFVEEVAP